MEGPKSDELKESELAPEGKHLKSIVNKVQNQRQERMQPGLEQSAVFEAARGESSAQNLLAFLITGGRVLHTVPAL